MSTELEQRYRDNIHKTEIAFLGSNCVERGVFATEDIDIGDIIFQIPVTECIQGNHLEMTYKLMETDNEYTRSLPVCITNFPVMWNKADVDSLKGSAMKEMISSRKKNLLEEDTKDKGPLFLHYRLLVGSRTFTDKIKISYF